MNIMEILDREGLNLAPAQKRILAFVIDDMIIAMLVFGIYFNPLIEIIQANTSDNAQMMQAISQMLSQFFIYIVLLKVCYHSFFTALYGASIGKIICKLKIIKIDTLDKPNILDSIIRSLLRTLGEMLFYIPLLLAFADQFQRALHDMASKTIVIDVSIPQDID